MKPQGRLLSIILTATWLFAAIRITAATLDLRTLTSSDIGAPVIAGNSTLSGQTLEALGAGTGVGPRTDQFQFAAIRLTNDFDIKFQVSALANIDALTKAGLMVRESLEPNAPFAAIFTSPSAAGIHLQSRATASGNTTIFGNAPANLPNSWLRLQRTNDLFIGFASHDGIHWFQVGATAVTLADSYVGFAVTSRSTNSLTRALFQNVADVTPTDVIVPVLQSDIEPPGPSSRRTALVISEIMYHPTDRSDGRRAEFIELYNSQPFFEDLSNWRIAGDYSYTFPTNTLIPGGGFIVIAPVPQDIRDLYGITNVVGGFTNSLPHGQGRVQLLSDAGAVYLDIAYRDKSPWPLAPDGTGHSLALVRPSYGEEDPRSWGPSTRPGGSPGSWEFTDGNPLRNLFLNEFLARPVQGGPAAFVELYNHSNVALDLEGCGLGYHPTQPEYLFPKGSRIEPRGFLALTPAQLGFAFRPDAEPLFLRAPNGGPVLDAVRFDPSRAGQSRGRFPDGSDEVHAVGSPTPGTPNLKPALAPVVLNELMYAPLSEDKDLQYVELHNPTQNPVDLTRWKLDDGIEFTFPTGAALGPGGYLVVARNAFRLRSVYTNLTPATCLGNFKGSLSKRGERIVLTRPELVNGRELAVPVDEVTYHTGGQWGYWSDGGGSSLERIDAGANSRTASSWADSDETKKGRWTVIESTGVLDLGTDNADSLHLGLLGEGECLVDNLEVIPSGKTNYITNPTFETAVATGFASLGNHIRSSIEPTEGFESTRSLHVRASGNMDTGANRIRFRFPRTIESGATVTLRARVRWLKGWPEFLMRLHGNWYDATGGMDVPLALGTPGEPNSQAVHNAGPSLSDLTHFPAAPASSQKVRFTVRVQDPSGVFSVVLKWRQDPAGDYQQLPMVDDGTGFDEIAGDGVYSAGLPEQASGTLIAYYAEATDWGEPPATTQYPKGAPVHEALVRFGEIPAGNPFGAYRIWLTQRSLNTWRNRPNLSNEPVEGTLVYGTFRAIHGAGYRYSGSPYHQQFSTPVGDCHYVWRLPGDDRLLGSDNFNKVHGPGNGPFDDDSIQREQTVYWMGRQLGLPWLYRRYVNVYVNGSKRRFLMEDTQVPGSDMVESYFPDDSDGKLFKLNPWFEFDSGTGQSIGFNNISWCDLNDYRSGNERRATRYRWNWQPRAVKGTVNDFSDLFQLIDAANAPTDSTFVSGMDSLVDMSQWLRTFALNHAVGNWDSFGNRNAQNMYAYKPERGPWRLFMWDANIVLGNAGFSDGPQGDDLFQYNFSDGPMGRIYNTLKYRRMYLQALKAIADGPMQATRVAALMDSKVSIFQTYGFTTTSAAIKSYIRSRLTYLNDFLNPYNNPFTATAQGVTDGTTAVNRLTLTGTAPLSIAYFTLNGSRVGIQWENETQWRLPIILDQVENSLLIEGWDAKGQRVAGASKSIQVRFIGTFERAQDKLVFTEIQSHPPIPGAEFVELLNASTLNTFSIGGWRIAGLDFTFPPDTTLAPGDRFVLTANAESFKQAYASTRAVYHGVWSGRLNPDGEVLRLIKPSVPPLPDELITSVAFSTNAPWPAIPAQHPSSLQLIDPSRGEDEHPGNWTFFPPRNPQDVDWLHATASAKAGADGTLQLYLSSNPPVVNPLDAVGVFFGTLNFDGNQFPYGVRFQKKDGKLTAGILYDSTNLDLEGALVGVSQSNLDVRFGFDAQNRFTGRLAPDGSFISGTYFTPFGSYSFKFARLNPGGSLVIDDISLTEDRPEGPGANLVSNGGFEADDLAPWQLNGTHVTSRLTSEAAHSGSKALQIQATAGGDGSNGNAVIQVIPNLVPGTSYTLGYWYQAGINASGLLARLADGSIAAPVKITAPIDPHLESTPSFTNSVAASLPAFPTVWLNEVLPVSPSSTPFVELVNSGTAPIDLGGLYLGEPGPDALRDRLPSGVSLAPGEFLTIALDGKAQLSDKANLHSSLAFTSRSGALVLTRVANDSTNTVDVVRWDSLPPGVAWGHYPDGVIAGDQAFAVPTPGAANSIATPTLPVFINEWLAGNTRIADPAGGPNSTEFDDWFELYNPNDTVIDLDGFFLSDSLAAPRQFRIPPGYSIPAHGYLLVWADNQPSQNLPSNPGLHANFKLDLDGESIVLSAPDGHLVDSVTFGPQLPDLSEGRVTDGAAAPFARFENPSPTGSNNSSPPAGPTLQLPSLDAGGHWTLTWASQPGRRYQIRRRPALDQPWELITPVVTASNPITTWTDPLSTASAQFYQLLVLE